ncbi:YlmC/YmxH family sporulation protein [Confluentibacter flavum]|uniref:Photosystem reaction center subunit H n=1 Tax=Confluentibacter flavum TaxID=1909700 RepID=A0A2N3HJF5_9FLAO|nr:PRC-barrel domain-containing protein [Confluentibacter flavum]PKQ45053.1 photosystem reaction center subunit H [Confluentibacter flavum]
MATENKKHLYYLNELSDYKISDGYPDVRGWDVKDFDNRVIGKVDNLLVNQDSQRVVYLDIEVDKSIIDANHDPYGRPNNKDLKEFVNKDGENHIILPIGLVDLNSDSNYVYTDIIDHRTFTETKRIRKGDTVGRNYERMVMSSYNRKTEKKPYTEPVLVEEENEYNNNLNEEKIREIVRDEMRTYRSEMNNDYSDNNLVGDNGYSDDDSFYDRPEFDDNRFLR